MDHTRTIFVNNFVLFEFWTLRSPQDRVENGDILILNLASRKPFWMKKILIENEIKSRVIAVDANGPRPIFDYGRFSMIESVIRRMKLRRNQRIELVHHMDLMDDTRTGAHWPFRYERVYIGMVQIIRMFERKSGDLLESIYH